MGGATAMVKGRFETRGSVLLGASVACAIAGMLAVDGVLLALGLASGIFLALAWGMGKRNLRGLGCSLVGPQAAHAGVPVRFSLSIANPRRIVDAFGMELDFETPGGLTARCRVPWVPAGSGADVELRVAIPGRGEGREVRFRLESGFPLGFFRFERVVEVPHPLRVVPRPILPVELLASGSAFDAAPSSTAGPREGLGEPRGLRSYRAGDRAKSIVWPASLRSQARGGGVMVREVDPPGFHPRRAVVLFHSYGSDGALIRPDRFERAISLLWGALRHFHGMGMPVVMLADFESWVPRSIVTRRQLGQAGELLSDVRRAPGTEVHELVGRLAELGREDAVMIVSDMEPRAWAAQIPARPRQVIVDVSRYERKSKSRRGIARGRAHA